MVVLFVLSKRDDDFSLEKRTVRVSDNFTSVLLPVRTSTDATAFRQETMITSTHNLPLPSFFIIWCIDQTNSPAISCIGGFITCFPLEKRRDIVIIPSVLERVQRWRVS